MKILIVDDENIIRMGIRTVIQRFGGDWVIVGEASDGIDALEQIESYPPDVIITDIRMPQMDGIELTKQIGERYPDMLVIIISGHAEFDFAQEAIRIGAMDYILKPTKTDTLIDVLSKAQKVIDIREEKRQEEERLHFELEFLRKELREKQAGTDFGSTDNDIKEGQNYRKVIGAAIDYMKQNYAMNLTLKHMGDVICMNHSYFCNLFKQETGKSFSEYLTEIRMEKAKEFLISRIDLKSYEVADMIGYRDSKYFCYIFKKLIGVTPTEFRDKN
jgi:two-component system, response regulator YesN